MCLDSGELGEASKLRLRRHRGYKFHSQPSTYKIPPGADTEPKLAGSAEPITLRSRRPVLAVPLP